MRRPTALPPVSTPAREPAATSQPGRGTPPTPAPVDDARTAPAPPTARRRDEQAEARRRAADAERALRGAERARRRYERKEARRFTRRARRHRGTVIGAIAAFAGMVLVVVVLAYSPILSVRSIQVVGAQSLDPEAVASALSGQLGRPLSLVDYGEIDSALAGFPRIASYVTESIPPDTLVVRIVERRPSMAVQGPSGFAQVDGAGVTLAEGPDRPGGLPLFDAGASPVGSPGFLSAAVVLRSLPPELLARIDAVQAPTAESVALVLAGGQRVLWGSVDDSALKAQILDRLLAQTAVQGSEIDVSSPQSPVVR